MKRTKKRYFRSAGIAAMIPLITLLFLSQVSAATKTWVGGDGFWNVDANWSSDEAPGVTGVPVAGDAAVITDVGDVQGNSVLYDNPLNPILQSLLIDNPSNKFPYPSLTQDGFTLTTKATLIGDTLGFSFYNQTRGTHTSLGDLTLGAGELSDGTYVFSGGKVSVAGYENIGVAGYGTFNQGEFLSGESTLTIGCHPPVNPPPVTPPPPVEPAHTVGKNLYLGLGSSGNGEFNLNRGSLIVNGSIRVGIEGIGQFNQDTGIVKIKGNNQDPLTNEAQSSDSGDFLNPRKVSAGTPSLQCVTSRNPGLIVGLMNEGTYNLTNGILDVNFSEIIGLATSSSGIFNQENGNHTISGNLYLGKDSGSYAEFNFGLPDLSGEPVSPEVGLVSVGGFGSVGYQGEGYFSQTGGTVKIKGIDPEIVNLNLRGRSAVIKGQSTPTLGCNQPQQYIGFTIGRGGHGEYWLTDGELLVSRGEVIGLYDGSIGLFEHSSGNHNVGGTLTIARDPLSTGTYNLKGGMLTAWGGIINNGTFNFSGGKIIGRITNNKDFIVAANPSATGTKTVAGDFLNSKTGVVSVNKTNISFNNTFMNSGMYESVGSSQTFKNLTVNPTGYLKVGVGDNITISGNLLNLRTQPGDWDTKDANVKFTGYGKHYFKTGSVFADGSVKNFNWLSLGMENGAVVVLQGHLKADQILGVDSNSQGSIRNLKGFCGIRIDYLPGDSLNAYLVGKRLYSTGDQHVGTFTVNGFDPVACH
jgi:hypothetical protein